MVHVLNRSVPLCHAAIAHVEFVGTLLGSGRDVVKLYGCESNCLVLHTSVILCLFCEYALRAPALQLGRVPGAHSAFSVGVCNDTTDTSTQGSDGLLLFGHTIFLCCACSNNHPGDQPSPVTTTRCFMFLATPRLLCLFALGLVRSSSAVDLAGGSSQSGHTPRMGVSSRVPLSNYSSLRK